MNAEKVNTILDARGLVSVAHKSIAEFSKPGEYSARSLCIPFPGFYCSDYSEQLDHAEETECEYIVESQEWAPDRSPEFAGLDASEICELFYWHSNYHQSYLTVARDYVTRFDALWSEALGFKLLLEFEEMTSPKEYNFQTDRIFCKAPANVIAALLATVKPETLRDTVKEKHSSRSGFISFYSNDVSEWLDMPLEDWDHNHLATLLASRMADAIAADSELEKWEFSIFEDMAESEIFYTAWSDCVDWPAVTAKALEKQAEKLETK